MCKALVLFTVMTLILGTTTSRAQAPANNALTGIPVFPSAPREDDQVSGGFCRLTAKTEIYYVPFLWGPNHTAAPKQVTVDEVVQWYQTRLKDFQYIPGSDGQRPQDVFLSADGTQAITITGTPHGPNAYAISFTLFSGRAQPSQVKSFAISQQVQC